MPFSAGTIVTDMDEQSIYFQERGVVARTQMKFWGPPEVTVQFERHLYPYLLSSNEALDGLYSVYMPDELRREDDWHPIDYARRLFSNHWHTCRRLSYPLNEHEPCMIDGCAGFQEYDVWFNYYGTIRNVYCCAAHRAMYHGRCVSSIVWRSEIACAKGIGKDEEL